jgi:hypothetical protein
MVHGGVFAIYYFAHPYVVSACTPVKAGRYLTKAIYFQPSIQLATSMCIPAVLSGVSENTPLWLLPLLIVLTLTGKVPLGILANVVDGPAVLGYPIPRLRNGSYMDPLGG